MGMKLIDGTGFGAAFYFGILMSSACLIQCPSVASSQEQSTLARPVTPDDIALAPFRAVYDLGLGDGAIPASLFSLSGRLVHELKGSDCEGYALTQRLVSRAELAEGQLVHEDIQSAAFEDTASRSFRFVTRSLVEEELRLTAKGYAQYREGIVDLLISEPEAKSIIMPGEVLFPVEYVKNMIVRLLNGDRFFNALLFDGSEDGDQLFRTTISSGPVSVGNHGDDQPVPLQGLKSWPVTVTYFNAEVEAANMEPDYMVSARVYENGISTSLQIRYQDVSMMGQLVDLTLFDKSVCPEANN